MDKTVRYMMARAMIETAEKSPAGYKLRMVEELLDVMEAAKKQAWDYAMAYNVPFGAEPETRNTLYALHFSYLLGHPEEITGLPEVNDA